MCAPQPTPSLHTSATGAVPYYVEPWQLGSLFRTDFMQCNSSHHLYIMVLADAALAHNLAVPMLLSAG